ncbi:hypothetical protein [Actinacidiphila acidipaludis]|uniref:Uncharacterized protein n=1 Tax=Actinacidiphila acidipaludis TaxID=2873382 RepID=A0ABS7Q8S5_9ACTN|nr:hypothetical protein [Streptomyces acidipaludis]MBY8879563.1 hypothetical protein [Streptomyces acidipaludis]
MTGAPRRAASGVADFLIGWALATALLVLAPWLWSHGGWADLGHRVAHRGAFLAFVIAGSMTGRGVRARLLRRRRARAGTAMPPGSAGV